MNTTFVYNQQQVQNRAAYQGLLFHYKNLMGLSGPALHKIVAAEFKMMYPEVVQAKVWN